MSKHEPPAWDAGDWHYCADANTGGELTAQYVLVLDALNWCFWPSKTDMEYDTLAMSLKRVLEEDSTAFSAEKLTAMTPELLSSWFLPHDMPNAYERAAKLREVGDVLSARFNGLAINLLREANGSAIAAVRLLVSNFPGFRDEAVYKGRQIFLYKRAQIAVGDWWAAFGRATDSAALATNPASFHDIASLTCFADYRIPQLFRDEGVLKYDPELEKKVDEKVEIAPGSQEEVEIRAGTVVAVEMLKDALTNLKAASSAAGATDLPRDLTSVEVDWYLWQWGEEQHAKGELRPHHRVNTVWY